MTFKVKTFGPGWAVYRGAERVTSSYLHFDRAVAAAERLEKKSEATERPCITCSRPFLSEGPGNRMCNPCRGGVGLDDGMLVPVSFHDGMPRGKGRN
ncbi:hypothetical protein ACXN5S_12395 [Pseudoroseicyclus sp. H15]